MTCRGWYLCDNALDLMLVLFARTGLPLLTEGVVSIVGAKSASVGGAPEDGFFLAKMRSELVFCRVRLRSGTGDN